MVLSYTYWLFEVKYFKCPDSAGWTSSNMKQPSKLLSNVLIVLLTRDLGCRIGLLISSEVLYSVFPPRVAQNSSSSSPSLTMTISLPGLTTPDSLTACSVSSSTLPCPDQTQVLLGVSSMNTSEESRLEHFSST